MQHSYLHPHLTPRALERVRDHGYAHLPSAVPLALVARLCQDVSQLTLRPAEAQVGSVRQAADMCVMYPPDWEATPAVRHLSTALAERIGGGWEPHEATVMRYSGTTSGISPHRDRSRYKRLIVIVSLWGESELEIVAERDGGGQVASFVCEPGDVVLLRAPELPGVGDLEEPRPLHAVRGPASGSRASLTYRMLPMPSLAATC